MRVLRRSREDVLPSSNGGGKGQRVEVCFVAGKDKAVKGKGKIKSKNGAGGNKNGKSSEKLDLRKQRSRRVAAGSAGATFNNHTYKSPGEVGDNEVYDDDNEEYGESIVIPEFSDDDDDDDVDDDDEIEDEVGNENENAESWAFNMRANSPKRKTVEDEGGGGRSFVNSVKRRRVLDVDDVDDKGIDSDVIVLSD